MDRRLRGVVKANTIQKKQNHVREESPLGSTQSSVGDSILVAHAKTVGPREAAEAISRQLAPRDLAMIIVFVSPSYDPQYSSKN
jgi:hypothetical protein